MLGRLVDVAASDAALDDKPSEKTTVDGQPPAASPAHLRREGQRW
jgi:hypothetical protein